RTSSRPRGRRCPARAGPVVRPGPGISVMGPPHPPRRRPPVAINDGIGNDIKDPFPGVSAGVPNHAPGSAGASGSAADSAGTTVVPPDGSWQNAFPAASGTVQPGQVSDSAIVPGPSSGLASTGAGSGGTGHWKRYPWQNGG